MARHLMNGEFPAFFWGQAYKGVPEVYAAAGAFAVFGSSVTVLKSVTLAFFAGFIAVMFILVEKVAGRWTAVAACLLLIVAPPALVFWSLDASAEYVLTMLLGTIFLLLCLRLEEARRAEGRGLRAELAGLGLVIGLGLWVHTLFVFYLLPAAIIFLLQREWWQRRAFGRVGFGARALAVMAAVYAVLAFVAFVSGGFAFQLGSIAVAVHSPQKMARIAAGLGVLACAAHAMTQVSSESARSYAQRYWPAVAGFLVGYSPVILYSLWVEPARSPARTADLAQLIRAAPDIYGNVIPILAGFKIATTERLDIPLAASAIIVAALLTYLESIRHRLAEFARAHVRTPTLAADFFPLFVVGVPLLFVVSGAYLDTQSYRYLVPYYAGLAVALAAGSLALAKGDKNIASIFVGMILVVFALQQFVWYRKLTPDTESARMIECLKKDGIRGGYADYWTSYKLTFLSNEDIILAPTNGVDRYPAYTEFVRALPDHQRVTKLPDCGASH
ncbi:MAG: hypothetical protein ND807_07365 [Vicinamibacterales bacterium]|nr:hypothetical protein [Vicinamibacterales bacterium]